MKSLPLFDAINQRLRWLSSRQQVISQNIANSNTPGYKPKDLKPQNFSTLLSQFQNTPAMNRSTKAAQTLKKSSSIHLSASGNKGNAFKIDKRRNYQEVTPNNNAVVLEEELIKMADVQMEYNLMLNTYRKHMSIIRRALGKNKG